VIAGFFLLFSSGLDGWFVDPRFGWSWLGRGGSFEPFRVGRVGGVQGGLALFQDGYVGAVVEIGRVQALRCVRLNATDPGFF
jgi:hypothetical protein